MWSDKPPGAAGPVPSTPAVQKAVDNAVPNAARAGAGNKDGLADAVEKTQEFLEDLVLPAPEAGLTLAKEKTCKVNIDKAVADAVAVSKLAMVGAMQQVDAALSVAGDHVSRVDIQAGISRAKQKSREIIAAAGPAAGKAGEWATEHRGLTTCAVFGGLGLSMVSAPALVATPLLGALGFGSGGVVAGSLAAAAQSGIGNVAAGSAFAFLQSAGAGGAALATINGVVQGAGLATAGIAAAQAAGGGGDSVHEKSGHEERSRRGPKEDRGDLYGEELKTKL